MATELDLGTDYRISETESGEFVIEHVPTGATFAYDPDSDTWETRALDVEVAQIDDIEQPSDPEFEQYSDENLLSAGHDWDHLDEEDLRQWIYINSSVRADGMVQTWGFAGTDDRPGSGRYGYHVFEGFTAENERVTLGGSKFESAGFLTYFHDGNHPEKSSTFGPVQVGSDREDEGTWLGPFDADFRVPQISVDDTRFYTASDDELDDVLPVSDGAVILLGNSQFEENRSIEGRISIQGTTGIGDDSGSRIGGDTRWAFSNRVVFEDVSLQNGSVIVSGGESRVRGVSLHSESSIEVQGDHCILHEIGGTGGELIVSEGAEETVIRTTKQCTVSDNGTRTLVNGRGTNEGSPNSTGEWEGRESYGEAQNAVIHDTENDDLFMAVGGSFVRIN